MALSLDKLGDSSDQVIFLMALRGVLNAGHNEICSERVTHLRLVV